MAIVKRVKLDSWVRRVKVNKPSVGASDLPEGLAYEHVYRELILVAPGGVDNDLPVGVPGLPDLPSTGLPEDPGVPDNELPEVEVPEQLPDSPEDCPEDEIGVDQELPEVEDPVDPGYDVGEDNPAPDQQ